MFNIDDYQQLIVLHRAIMEAKFSAEPRDTALPGSSILSCLANEVVDSLIRMADEKGNIEASQSWSDWRKVGGHAIEIEVIKENIAKSKGWKNWSTEQKCEYIAILLSPFSYDERFLRDLILYGDSKH